MLRYTHTHTHTCTKSHINTCTDMHTRLNNVKCTKVYFHPDEHSLHSEDSELTPFLPLTQYHNTHTSLPPRTVFALSINSLGVCPRVALDRPLPSPKPSIRLYHSTTDFFFCHGWCFLVVQFHMNHPTELLLNNLAGNLLVVYPRAVFQDCTDHHLGDIFFIRVETCTIIKLIREGFTFVFNSSPFVLTVTVS